MDYTGFCAWTILRQWFLDFFGLCLKQGLFEVPELVDYTGFNLLKEKACDQTNELVKEAVNPNRNRKLVVVFDELSDSLCKVADLVSIIQVFLGHLLIHCMYLLYYTMLSTAFRSSINKWKYFLRVTDIWRGFFSVGLYSNGTSRSQHFKSSRRCMYHYQWCCWKVCFF